MISEFGQPPTSPEVVYLRQVVDHATSLVEVLQQTKADRAVQTGFGYNLARSLQGLGEDILLGQSRFLVYSSNAQDAASYWQLYQARIPQLTRVAFNPSTNVVATAVPLGTRPLDSFEFREQRGTQGRYTGAIEIMQQLGSYAALMKKRAQVLPSSLELIRLAFLNGEQDFIRLIPPLSLSHQVDIHTLSEDLRLELMQQLPNISHTTQLDAFMASFNQGS